MGVAKLIDIGFMRFTACKRESVQSAAATPAAREAAGPGWTKWLLQSGDRNP